MAHYVFFWLDFVKVWHSIDATEVLSDQPMPGVFLRVIINMMFYTQLTYFTITSLMIIFTCLISLTKIRELRRQMDIHEQMRRAADPTYEDPELGNIQNFLRMRGEDVDFGGEQGDNGVYLARIGLSVSDIENALHP